MTDLLLTAMLGGNDLLLMTRRQIKGAVVVAGLLVAGLVALWLVARMIKARRAGSTGPGPEPERAAEAEPARERYVDQGVANVLAHASARENDTRTIDDMLDEALRIVTSLGGVSVPALQRKLGIDFDRATEVVERLETDGYVSASGAGGKRKVLPPAYERVERLDGEA